MDSPVARQSFTNYSQSSNSELSPYGNEFVPDADMGPAATEDPFGLSVINSGPEEVAKIQEEKFHLAVTKEESLQAKMERFYAKEEFGNVD